MNIQSGLKAPKGQYNSFGKYKYRSAEDIMEAVKPLLAKYKAALTVSDDMVTVGARIYVRATATLLDAENDGTTLVATALAQEAAELKGMSPSQITGVASSYARKYALNGLFCIDDTKDDDALNTSKEYTEAPADLLLQAIGDAKIAPDVKALQNVWVEYRQYQSDKRFIGAVNQRKKVLTA